MLSIEFRSSRCFTSSFSSALAALCGSRQLAVALPEPSAWKLEIASRGVCSGLFGGSVLLSRPLAESVRQLILVVLDRQMLSAGYAKSHAHVLVRLQRFFPRVDILLNLLLPPLLMNSPGIPQQRLNVFELLPFAYALLGWGALLHDHLVDFGGSIFQRSIVTCRPTCPL